jgi:hypothetical protein
MEQGKRTHDPGQRAKPDAARQAAGRSAAGGGAGAHALALARSTPPVQRKCAVCGKDRDRIQRKPGAGGCG